MDVNATVFLRSGHEMPVLGLGTWELTSDTAGVVAEALRAGYRMIDTSGDYGTQSGIADGIQRSGIDRDDLYVVTKIEETDEAFLAVQRNLRELRLDRANLILIHRPPNDGSGVGLWRGLIRARDAGLTDDIGVSNYAMNQIAALIEETGEVPAVNQIEWSPFGRSDGMMAYAADRQMKIQAYSPLTRTIRLENLTLEEIALRHARSPAQVLIRWNLQLGTVPLPKASRLEHLRENIDVFDFELSKEDMAALDDLNEEFSSLGSLPYV